MEEKTTASKSTQKPSVGRIVHYTRNYSTGKHGESLDPKGQPYPAVITHVWGETVVNLNVIDDGSYPLTQGETKPTSVPFSPEPRMGCWSWPPKV